MASRKPALDGTGMPSSAVPSPPRRPPSLLPAADILSSSPLPRPTKRKHDEPAPDPARTVRHYPTPVPTSSTAVPASSPARRPALQRTASALSERTPLGSVPTAEVPLNGEPLLLGRSSNSSNYQLAANRLISRVHVRASYHPPDAQYASGCVQIECLGWNGAKVHCRGQVYPLGKGDVFKSDAPSAEMMLDVQDTRVIIAWPAVGAARSASAHSDTSWTDISSPRGATGAAAATAPVPNRMASSPPPMAPRSPESPSPAYQPVAGASQTFVACLDAPSSSSDLVEVYEDPSSDPEPVADAMAVTEPRQSPQSSTLCLASFSPGKISQSSLLSHEDFSDHDEENDPIVHSFGPFGENILPRLHAVSTSSPGASHGPHRRHRKPLRATSSSPKKRTSAESVRQSAESGLRIGLNAPDADEVAASKPRSAAINESPIRNHVINQLAYSRVNAIPLSQILGTLPVELKGQASEESSSEPAHPVLTSPALKQILDNIACVGEIAREGKDAAGKPLENEYYYVPEMDTDAMRRDTVVGSRGGTGLRAVRKSHKQYFWKRPRV